jgi:hypothetical protein
VILKYTRLPPVNPNNNSAQNSTDASVSGNANNAEPVLYPDLCVEDAAEQLGQLLVANIKEGQPCTFEISAPTSSKTLLVKCRYDSWQVRSDLPLELTIADEDETTPTATNDTQKLDTIEQLVLYLTDLVWKAFVRNRGQIITVKNGPYLLSEIRVFARGKTHSVKNLELGGDLGSDRYQTILWHDLTTRNNYHYQDREPAPFFAKARKFSISPKESSLMTWAINNIWQQIQESSKTSTFGRLIMTDGFDFPEGYYNFLIGLRGSKIEKLRKSLEETTHAWWKGKFDLDQHRLEQLSQARLGAALANLWNEGIHNGR